MHHENTQPLGGLKKYKYGHLMVSQPFIKMFRYKEVQLKFAEIFRVFISGSSSAGKTHFARRLLEAKFFDFDRVYYFHPDFHETSPVDWPFDILYHPGLPTLEDLLAIPEKSCLIFDDLYHECVNSNEIDYLYRVLSSKRKLHCIVMTQRYFAQGKHAVSIRNSSNYHVLMRNADERINLRAADSMNLKKEVLKANEYNENEMYPYMFIDRSNQARVTGLKVYIDLFSKCMKVIMGTQLKALVDWKEFTSRFKLIDENVAVEYAPTKKKLPEPSTCIPERPETARSTEPGPAKPGATEPGPIKPARTGPGPGSKSTGTERRTSRRQKRKEFTRRVRQIIHRYKKRTVV